MHNWRYSDTKGGQDTQEQIQQESNCWDMKEVEAGRQVTNVCRAHSISDATDLQVMRNLNLVLLSHSTKLANRNYMVFCLIANIA